MRAGSRLSSRPPASHAGRDKSAGRHNLRLRFANPLYRLKNVRRQKLAARIRFMGQPAIL
ncbi:hypothetical protein EAM01S_02_01500 [Erwinia amylovora NBRC 12687 = CFBP 1232]|nr:hypothetical protein EAM01S_02_01500 [Erwinia amylovora NBRC 12687 = CFBP 1232]